MKEESLIITIIIICVIVLFGSTISWSQPQWAETICAALSSQSEPCKEVTK